MKKLFALFSSLGLIILVLPQTTFASYFYLSPDSISVDQNSTTSFDIKLNTEGEVINGVSSFIAFPQDKLEIKSAEINKSLLPIVAEESLGDSIVKLSGANLSSINGSDLTVGHVVFKTKTTGTALLQFITGSAVPRTFDSTDSLNLAKSKSASIAIRKSSGNDNSGDNHSNLNPSDYKVFRCQDKESSNKTKLSSLANQFLDLKARLDTVFVLVDGYSSLRGKSSTEYTNQKQQVETKRNTALEGINSFKNDADGFNCQIKNPKDLLSKLKQESQTTSQAVKDYKSALRQLINVLINLK